MSVLKRFEEVIFSKKNCILDLHNKLVTLHNKFFGRFIKILSWKPNFVVANTFNLVWHFLAHFHHFLDSLFKG